jgi:hypothetical protein
LTHAPRSDTFGILGKGHHCRFVSPARPGAVAFGVLLAALASPVAAQQVAPWPDGTLSVHADQVTLGAVLRAIGDVNPFEKLALDPAVEGRLVTVSIERADPLRALMMILESAEVDYAVAGPKRLVVGKSFGVIGLAARVDEPAPDATLPESIEQTPIDPAAEQLRMQRQNVELEQAFSRPAALPPPGSVLLLPFPAADGSPLTAIKPAPGTPVALPFPSASVVAAPAPGLR